MTWVNHAEVIKDTAPEVVLMKGTISTGHVISDYMISWQMKRTYATFTKAVRHQTW